MSYFNLHKNIRIYSAFNPYKKEGISETEELSREADNSAYNDGVWDDIAKTAEQ